MSRSETLCTVYGEFMDLLACDSISNGTAKYKRPKRRMGFDDLMKVR